MTDNWPLLDLAEMGRGRNPITAESSVAKWTISNRH